MAAGFEFESRLNFEVETFIPWKAVFFFIWCDCIISPMCASGSANRHVLPLRPELPGCTRIRFARDSSDVPRAGREKERSLWNGVVRHSVEFHRMWGETRTAYSCFLPDTEGGRWRAKERKKREEEGERERALRSVMCTDVAAALGQTLPVFCVHLRLVSPVLL